jgi:ABC-type ATPase with predicted acetyltransferase domain
MIIFPLNALPWTISGMKNAKTSFSRVFKYLRQKEASKNPPTRKSSHSDNSETPPAITLSFEKAIWPSASQDPNVVKIETEDNSDTEKPEKSSFCLKLVNLQIPVGSLTMIIGSTASGKTALLNAILGEMEFLGTKKEFVEESKFEFNEEDLEEVVAAELKTAVHSKNKIVRNVNGKVCLISQIPWIQNKSIQVKSFSYK